MRSKTAALAQGSLLLMLAALGVAALVYHYALAAEPTLETRLKALEDRDEIRSLLIEYGRALDEKDFGAFASLFAKTEGEWIGGLGRAKGEAAIRELMESTIGRNAAAGPPTSFHVLSNESIDVDGDRATAVTKWVFVRQNAARNPEWVFLGHYDDTFIRENGRWRFLRREAFTDIPVQTGQ
jgi:3-phenylpropionate/cinnamic acid dioxygenase small subunit